ncbi:MAG: UDP-N-acetyl-D-glucosamine dehydrogenase [Thermoleophilia bacterium]|nr:UDP-N-acetyl-D-glucosamine dehydrogenase [Thermoleophilia bacterium]
MTATTASHSLPEEPLPESFRPEVAIVGLGYVGLPLAMTFADGGATVLGVDVDPSKPIDVREGRSWIEDVPSSDVAAHVEAGRFLATTDVSHIALCDAVIIAVPTPLNRNREPDLGMVEAATRSIAPYLQPGQLVVLESTTWPGTTREILEPLLANGAADGTKREVGVDFHLAYSPERVDPGNATWNTKNTPKVVGGMTDACTDKAVALYERAVDSVHRVSAPEAAELEKLFENIFRNVNIALVNELAMLCERMDIDVWEVIDAAATKPFGFMKFTPGPGLGGHCIPIDPFYLSWKAREYDFSTEFIELAGKINTNMPYHCVRLLRNALDAHGKAMRGARVLVIGVAYKKDITDYRESSAIKILELLQKRGVEVVYHDPFVPEIQAGHGVEPPAAPANISVELTPEELDRADAVMVLTDHSGIDWQHVLDSSPLVVDFRNVYAGTPRSNQLWKL